MTIAYYRKNFPKYSNFGYVSREQLLRKLLEHRVDRKIAINFNFETATNVDNKKRLKDYLSPIFYLDTKVEPFSSILSY